MKAEAHSQNTIAAKLVNEKVRAEAAHANLLMDIENSERKTAAEVLRLQEQLAEANVMVDAHKETIAELCEDNKRLRSQHGDMERIVPAYENLQRENEDLRDS